MVFLFKRADEVIKEVEDIKNMLNKLNENNEIIEKSYKLISIRFSIETNFKMSISTTYAWIWGWWFWKWYTKQIIIPFIESWNWIISYKILSLNNENIIFKIVEKKEDMKLEEVKELLNKDEILKYIKNPSLFIDKEDILNFKNKFYIYVTSDLLK